MPHGPKPQSQRKRLWQRRGYVMVYAVPAAEAVQLPPPPSGATRPKRGWADYALRVLVKIAGATL